MASFRAAKHSMSTCIVSVNNRKLRQVLDSTLYSLHQVRILGIQQKISEKHRRVYKLKLKAWTRTFIGLYAEATGGNNFEEWSGELFLPTASSSPMNRKSEAFQRSFIAWFMGEKFPIYFLLFERSEKSKKPFYVRYSIEVETTNWISIEMFH